MSIPSQVRRVAALLKRRQLKVVFAESCTGGLVCGALTRIPGISQYLCGSMVVYRSETKAAWLGIPAEVLTRPGPVSQKVTKLLAAAVLNATPEADLALAVTGHLGPNAPKRLDGIVYFQIGLRHENDMPQHLVSSRARYPATMTRQQRQRGALEEALKMLGDFLETAFVGDADS